jgi:hypothetical protein
MVRPRAVAHLAFFYGHSFILRFPLALALSVEFRLGGFRLG